MHKYKIYTYTMDIIKNKLIPIKKQVLHVAIPLLFITTIIVLLLIKKNNIQHNINFKK